MLQLKTCFRCMYLSAWNLLVTVLDSGTEESASVLTDDKLSVLQRSSPALLEPSPSRIKRNICIPYGDTRNADKNNVLLNSPNSTSGSSYSPGPLSAGQRRAHWRYFSANSHPQSNCDNNLSQTDNTGRSPLYRHSSYPLSGQHLMTCINIDSPDDNNENLSPPQTSCPNNNLNNNNNYNRGVPCTNNSGPIRRAGSHNRQFTPDAIVHSEGEEEEDEDDDVQCVEKNSEWSMPTKVSDTLIESAASPTSIEGDESSQRDSVSGLSFSPSFGSFLDPHPYKSSPSLDLIPQQESQISEDPTSQSHSLYQTAESLPNDSDSDLDPFHLELDPQGSPPRSSNGNVTLNHHQQQLQQPQLQSPVQQLVPLPIMDANAHHSPGTMSG